jgi:hypothetical protein
LTAEEPCDEAVGAVVHFTEEDVYHVQEQMWDKCDTRYTEVTMVIMEEVGIFPSEAFSTAFRELAPWASDDNLQIHYQWETTLQNIKRTNRSGVPSIHSDDSWVCLENASGTSGNIQAAVQAVVMERQELGSLKRDQRRAHDMIAQHLNAYLAGPHPLQLLMLIPGAGGTGKTTLIEQITKTFSEWNTGRLLAKTATTSIAAVTVHPAITTVSR